MPSKNVPSSLKTTTIRGVELARVGQWVGTDGLGRPVLIEITKDDLRSAVEAAAYGAEKLGEGEAQSPIKLGHTMKQQLFGKLAAELGDGEPAFGWAVNLSVSPNGEVLLGDFERVPVRLAEFLEVGAWRRRSIEFRRDRLVADREYPFVVTAVSLLGAFPPAVKSLADVYGASEGSDPDRFFLSSGMSKTLTKAEIDDMVAQLSAVFDGFEPHFAGRAGAPMVRALFKACKVQLLRAANYTTEDGHMREAVLALLGLKGDADDTAAIAKLSSADETTLQGLYRLALNADAALAVGCEILGIPGATPDDFLAKLREIAGVEPADAPAAGDTPPPPASPGAGLAAPTDGADRVTMLERRLAEAETKFAESVIGAKKAEARARAERDVQTNGLLAPVLDVLISLAEGGQEDLYRKVVATTGRVPKDEKGSSKTGKLSEISLTPEELAIAKDLGTDLDALRRTKAAALGIVITPA